MDAHNLATVIAPNILKEKTDKTVAMDDSSFLGIEAVNLLLDFNDEMCEVSTAIRYHRIILALTFSLGPGRSPVHLEG